MYLSQLQLDPHSQAVRRDLHSPWELHRSLWSAFPEHLHKTDERILWRLDAARDGGACVLVQSQDQPDWGKLLSKYRHYCSVAPQTKSFDPDLQAGQRLRFRLRANPSVKREGKRRSLINSADQLAWLNRQGERGGFQPLAVDVLDEGTRRFKKDDSHAQLCVVLYEGELIIKDINAFKTTLQNGIGHGKGFGLGLLSIARV